MTNEEILLHLKNIETEYNVKILYAVESGSRAWGFASPDSDWDVRFIYVHPLNWYLKVELSRDVIEVSTEDGFDAAGWDIRKTLQLFRRTNPSLTEWLRSPIIYIDEFGFKDKLLELESLYFNEERAMYHYYYVATNHRRRYLEKRGVELKRYLYFFRSLLAAKWVQEKHTVPPVPFQELMTGMVSEKEILKEMDNLLKKKSMSKEHDKEIVSDILQEYGLRLQEEVEQNLMRIKKTEKPQDQDKALNELMKEMILKENLK